MGGSAPGGLQQLALVLLRTLIGWHFLWEGFVKLWWPAWSRDGWPLARWSSAGYLRGATGPFADTFHALADSRWLPVLDVLVAVALLLAGLSLILGLFTQWGATLALLLLALFYVTAIPTRGVAEPGAEGAYLYVNKNLVEAAALFVVLVFRTGRIAGLDLLRGRRRPAPEHPAAEAEGRRPGEGTLQLDPDDLEPDTPQGVSS
jgi:thiosulfate dehydrogenase [quinone] large subunit